MSDSSGSIYSIENIINHIYNNIDAAYVVDLKNDNYTSLKSNTMFFELFGTYGSYGDMVRKLLFLNSSEKEEPEKYQVFKETFENLKGKHKRIVNVVYNEKSVLVCMSSYHLRDDEHFVVVMDEIDET